MVISLRPGGGDGNCPSVRLHILWLRLHNRLLLRSPHPSARRRRLPLKFILANWRIKAWESWTCLLHKESTFALFDEN
ncbi:hypothetical protein OPV22_018152 [Ensete ventricosum]|uniref:Uncharacterized protein n=1 Tax=Ensete ventricosum TaxID=4639 RepID=A0AAV8R2L9_ENSVE|nr:hypothetical protein OPV22_018152 [Ensete ventricosum]